jgi:polyhydroxyalkanoate synthesis regulator protein
MVTKSDYDVSQMFDSAINAFGDAMKAGVKAQEEIVKWWSNSLNGGTPLGDWQKRSKQMFDEAVPAAQRNAEEWLKVVEQNYRRSVELLKKAMDSDQNGAVNSLRDKTRKLWEESLTVVKENAESMAQANVKMMELWTDLMRKNLEQTEAVMKQTAAAAAAKK